MRPSYCAAFLCHWSLFKGADKGAPLVAKARKGAFFGPSFPTFLFTKVMLASGLELSEESGRNCGFQRKRAFLYSSFPPTPVLSSLSSAVRRKRVFLPTVPGRLEREEEGAWQGRESLPPSLPYTQNMAQDARKTGARI